MNNEIKEILDRLNKIVPYADVPKELAYMTTNITPQECKILLDYITNLQQENEKLEKHKEYYKNETKRLGKLFYITKEENIRLEEAQKNFEKQFIKEMDYKSRIEKAVEYIKENDFTNDKNFMDTGIGNLFKVILKFLEGRSDE